MTSFGRRHSLLGHPIPAGELGPPCGRLTGHAHERVRTPNGVTTFRTHELRSGWAPSVPRGQRCSPRTGPLPGRRLPLRNGMSLSPPYIPSTRLRLTRHQPRVHACSPVRSSLACDRPDGTGRPWASPGLRTPPTKSRTAHARAGTGHRARTWNYTLNSSSVDLQSDSSLVTCDLVSQVA